MSFRHFFPALAVALGACAATSANTPVSPNEQDWAELYITNRPTQPYAERGIIEVSQHSGEESDDVLALLRRRATAEGCDGVILLGTTSEMNGRVMGGSGLVRSRNVYRGTCVVYGAAAGTAATAPTPAKACVPNETQLCHGPGACQGAQSCREDGMGYTACDCGAANPVAPGSAAAPDVSATPVR